jgi:hypothetical protein
MLWKLRGAPDGRAWRVSVCLQSLRGGYEGLPLQQALQQRRAASGEGHTTWRRLFTPTP